MTESHLGKRKFDMETYIKGQGVAGGAHPRANCRIINGWLDACRVRAISVQMDEDA